MRLCLMIEGQEDVTWPDWVALAETCEAVGIEALFRSDHYLSGDGQIGRGSHDAWTTLAAIAARTSRLRLGTMVSPVTFRHPSVIANAVTTVDHISGGRVELGLGAGWYRLEHRSFGFPFPPIRERMDMLEEQLEIVVRQWTEQEFSFDGTHYQLEACRALPRPPRTVDLAARFAQEYNIVSADPQACRAVRRSLDEAAQRHGRPQLRFSFMETTLIGRTRDELLERAGRLGALHFDGISGEQLLAERVDGWVCGTLDEVAGQFEDLAAAGLERAMLQHLDHRDLDAVRMIGEQLAPRVAGL
jgi:alkanesulfonate monooxygenase SsuD/methylene tetrahydromethanopterin reductase-like flavin-dependent oxidoreductase (luciferase family)